jgi:hypothetical protein
MGIPKRYAEPTDVVGAPRRQEERVAAGLGGRRQPGSGSWAGAKGDVVVEGPVGWLLECKRTVHASLAVQRAWLVKVTREAWALGKQPALGIEIAGGDPSPAVPRDWVAIPLEQFRRLVAAAAGTVVDGDDV